MKTQLLVASIAASVVAAGMLSLSAQDREWRHPGVVHVPDSSIERGEDHGLRAHTNHVIHLRSATPLTTPQGESPASIRSFYNLPSTGGSGVIAIVDAYHYATALQDFNTFSTQWGVRTEPSASATGAANVVFQVMYASGRQPQSNCGWAQEEALDIEWAHAIAPGAKIVLVEAASSSYANLMQAVDVASAIPGVAQVSMSWGGSEFSAESSYDSHFGNHASITYFAASGDTGGHVLYPSASPDVVSAGGTTLGSPETAWSGSGGGPSAYEPLLGFQSTFLASSPILSQFHGHRGTPDLSFDADPSTGVSVYDSTSCQGLKGWLVFGGTSVAAPSLAGVANLGGANNGRTELTAIYSGYAGTYPGSEYTSQDFDDVTNITSRETGNRYAAGPNWDFVTGIGSVRGIAGK